MYKIFVDTAFVAIYLLLIVEFTKSYELYEGNRCWLENRQVGLCKKLHDCPSRMKEVQDGIRSASSTGRCGFDGFVEIVCCPVNPGTRPRRADYACRYYRSLNVTDPNPHAPHFIHGGNVAARSAYPFMVALGYPVQSAEGNSSIKYNCGGTLISLSHVLTSAHCVSNIDERVPVEALLGTTYIPNDTIQVQRHAIADIIIHPQYRRSTSYNDVAILKLKTSVRPTTLTLPGCFYTLPLDTVNKTLKFIVPGWGATDLDTDSSNWLLETPFLEMMNREDCSVHYRNFAKLTHGLDNTLICTIDANTTRRGDACSGDSGGPLLLRHDYRYVIAGITSFGAPCGSYVPGVYTAIYPFLDWIEQIVWPQNSG